MRRSIIALALLVASTWPATSANDDVQRALQVIRPGAQWVLMGQDCSGLIWYDATQSAPTCAEITTAAAALPAKDAQLDSLDIITLKVLFNHENRIRVLEGKAAITLAQFKAALKALP